MEKVDIEALRQEAHKKLENGEMQVRSCWNCNPAHKHLKKSNDVICCFECGNWYYKGVDITEH